MTAQDQKALGHAALVLLAAGIVRFSLAPPASDLVLAPGRESVTDSLLLAGDSAAQVNERRKKPLATGETLDPNIANAIELDRLPGIGASKAAGIVAERENGGPFARVEDLIRVPGLGKKTLDRLRPHLRLGPTRSRRIETTAKERSLQRRRLGVMEERGGRSLGSVDVNSVGVEELKRLPGIGEVLARRILTHRRVIGGFSSLKDLLQVPGIGPAKLQRLEGLIEVRP